MREAWITGIGLVTALGPDRETTWRRLLAGETGIGPLTLFDTTGYRTHIAAQVDDAPARAPGARRRRGVATPAGPAASRWPPPPRRWRTPACRSHRRATALGAGARRRHRRAVRGRGVRRTPPARGPRVRGLAEFVEVPQDAPTDRVGLAFGLTGPRITVTTACSSSTIAVGLAAELVGDGEAPVALAGGTDALCRLTYAGFNSLHAVDPEPARPFDREAQRAFARRGRGGAGDRETADQRAARGARPYARVLGYGVTNDAFHMTQPEPSGAAWERTVRAALADAGVARSEVWLHQRPRHRHRAERPRRVRRLPACFRRDGSASVPVSSVKGALGHCLCAAGGIEAAITALAIARATLPPTVGFAEADPACPRRRRSRALAGRTSAVALSSSFAFGGNSAVLVLGSCS